MSFVISKEVPYVIGHYEVFFSGLQSGFSQRLCWAQLTVYLDLITPRYDAADNNASYNYSSLLESLSLRVSYEDMNFI